MVTVPVYNLRQVAPRPDMQQGVEVRASDEAFGAGIGRGMQQIGQGLGKASDAFAQLREFDEGLAIKDAMTGYDREKMELDYGPNGYLTTQGRNAVDGREKYVSDLEALKKKYGATLKGGAARRFDDAATEAVTGGMRTAIVHSAQGRKDWAAASSTARLATFQDQALTAFRDPKAVDKAVAAGFMEIDAQASLMGWDADVVAVKRQEHATGVYSQVALAMAGENGGATKALGYLASKAEMIDPATRMDMEAKLKPYATDEAAMTVVDEILGMGRDTGGTAPAADGSVGSGGPTAVRSRLYARAGAAGKGKDHVDGLTEGFATNLLAMFEDAPPGIRDGLQIGSGYRSEERQAEIISENMGKYGLGSERANWLADVQALGPAAAGDKWRGKFKAAGLTKFVGMPGESNHQSGNAVDIWYNGTRLEKAPAEVIDYVHKNAPSYGLRFPMSWESWHIEPTGARGGSTAVPARDGVSARASMTSFDAAIARVNEIEDPDIRAAAMKQLNAQFEMRGKAESAASTAAKSEIWSMVAQGMPMSQVPLDLKIAAGREAVVGFMDYEGKAGEITTDPIRHRNLTLYAATNPVEFARIDLTAPEMINGLSKDDLKALTEKQASVLTDERKAREEGLNVSSAMNYAEVQLKEVGIITGDSTAARTKENATRVAEFQMALADEMRAWSEENQGRKPTQMDIMQMTNRLLLPIVLNVPGSGTFSDTSEVRLFETITAPDNATYDVNVSIDDIPRTLRDAIRRDMMIENGGLPVSDDDVIVRYEALQTRRPVPVTPNPRVPANVTTTKLGLIDMLNAFVDRADPPQ